MNLLLVHPHTAGDVLRTTPALAALRRLYPEARIGFAVEDRFADVIAGCPGLDEVIPIPAAVSVALRTLPADASLPPEAEALRERLRAFRPDRVYNPSASREAAWVARLAGCETVGYVIDGAGVAFHHPEPGRAEEILHRRDRVNRIRFYLDLVGAPADAPDVPTVVVTEEARAEAARLLGEDRRPLCAIQPGAGNESEVWAVKRTPAEELCLLASDLERDGFRIVTVGSAAERERAEIVAAMCRDALNLAGATSWPVLAAVLARADLYVGHDSGPSHLSTALGRPSVVIFLGSSPILNAPLGGPSLLVQADDPVLLLCRGTEEEARRAFSLALDRTRAPVLREAARAILLLAAGAEADSAGLLEAARAVARVRRAGLCVWRDGRLERPVLRCDLRSLAAGAARGEGDPVAGRVVTYIHEVLSRYERAEVGYRDPTG